MGARCWVVSSTQTIQPLPKPMAMAGKGLHSVRKISRKRDARRGFAWTITIPPIGIASAVMADALKRSVKAKLVRPE
jgi:hypothetical protein